MGAPRRCHLTLARAALGVALVPGGARAQDRIELAHVPDVLLLEPVLKLDSVTDPSRRSSSDIGGALAMASDLHGRQAGSGWLALGTRAGPVIAAVRGDLAASPHGLRGRHAALIEARTANHDKGLGGVVTLRGRLDHGERPGLTPVHLGPLPGASAMTEVDGALQVGVDDLAFALVTTVHAGIGRDRWEAGPVDRADRVTGGLGLGLAPTATNRRGVIDVVRVRVEHATRMARGAGATAARPGPSGSVVGETKSRAVEIGLGTTELSFYSDRTSHAVFTTDVGWTWLELDTPEGRLADNALRVELGAAVRWRIDGDDAVRQFGLAAARTPTHSADGRRLVGDWRAELLAHVDHWRFVVGGRGGVSWLVAHGNDVPGPVVIRYGGQLEGFVKLVHGLEVGLQHASWFEPRASHDPWAAARSWTIETSAVARWRSRPGTR